MVAACTFFVVVRPRLSPHMSTAQLEGSHKTSSSLEEFFESEVQTSGLADITSTPATFGGPTTSAFPVPLSYVQADPNVERDVVDLASPSPTALPIPPRLTSRDGRLEVNLDSSHVYGSWSPEVKELMPLIPLTVGSSIGSPSTASPAPTAALRGTPSLQALDGPSDDAGGGAASEAVFGDSTSPVVRLTEGTSSPLLPPRPPPGPEMLSLSADSSFHVIAKEEHRDPIQIILTRPPAALASAAAAASAKVEAPPPNGYDDVPLSEELAAGATAHAEHHHHHHHSNTTAFPAETECARGAPIVAVLAQPTLPSVLSQGDTTVTTISSAVADVAETPSEAVPQEARLSSPPPPLPVEAQPSIAHSEDQDLVQRNAAGGEIPAIPTLRCPTATLPRCNTVPVGHDLSNHSRSPSTTAMGPLATPLHLSSARGTPFGTPRHSLRSGRLSHRTMFSCLPGQPLPTLRELFSDIPESVYLPRERFTIDREGDKELGKGAYGVVLQGELYPPGVDAPAHSPLPDVGPTVNSSPATPPLGSSRRSHTSIAFRASFQSLHPLIAAETDPSLPVHKQPYNENTAGFYNGGGSLYRHASVGALSARGSRAMGTSWEAMSRAPYHYYSTTPEEGNSFVNKSPSVPAMEHLRSPWAMDKDAAGFSFAPTFHSSNSAEAHSHSDQCSNESMGVRFPPHVAGPSNDQDTPENGGSNEDVYTHLVAVRDTSRSPSPRATGVFLGGGGDSYDSTDRTASPHSPDGNGKRRRSTQVSNQEAVINAGQHSPLAAPCHQCSSPHPQHHHSHSPPRHHRRRSTHSHPNTEASAAAPMTAEGVVGGHGMAVQNGDYDDDDDVGSNTQPLSDEHVTHTLADWDYSSTEDEEGRESGDWVPFHQPDTLSAAPSPPSQSPPHVLHHHSSADSVVDAGHHCNGSEDDQGSFRHIPGSSDESGEVFGDENDNVTPSTAAPRQESNPLDTAERGFGVHGVCGGSGDDGSSSLLTPERADGPSLSPLSQSPSGAPTGAAAVAVATHATTPTRNSHSAPSIVVADKEDQLSCAAWPFPHPVKRLHYSDAVSAEIARYRFPSCSFPSSDGLLSSQPQMAHADVREEDEEGKEAGGGVYDVANARLSHTANQAMQRACSEARGDAEAFHRQRQSGEVEEEDVGEDDVTTSTGKVTLDADSDHDEMRGETGSAAGVPTTENDVGRGDDGQVLAQEDSEGFQPLRAPRRSTQEALPEDYRVGGVEERRSDDEAGGLRRSTPHELRHNQGDGEATEHVQATPHGMPPLPIPPPSSTASSSKRGKLAITVRDTPFDGPYNNTHSTVSEAWITTGTFSQATPTTEAPVEDGERQLMSEVLTSAAWGRHDALDVPLLQTVNSTTSTISEAMAAGAIPFRSVAVKVICKPDLAKPASFQAFHNEMVMASQLNHPCLVNIFGVAEDNSDVFLVMDLAENGNLDSYIKRFGVSDTREMAPRFLADVILALEYLRDGSQHPYRPSPVNELLMSHPSSTLLDNPLGRRAMSLGSRQFLPTAASASTSSSAAVAAIPSPPSAPPVTSVPCVEAIASNATPDAEPDCAAAKSTSAERVGEAASATSIAGPEGEEEEKEEEKTGEGDEEEEEGKSDSGDGPTAEDLIKSIVLHRDIKPDNMLLTWDYHIKLGDFGTSCFLGDEEANRFGGTPAYISPEVLTKDKAGPYSDLWALGCVLYELLEGRSPFRGETPFVSTQKVKNYVPGSLTFSPDISCEARALVEELLQIVPEDRLGAEERGGFAALKAHPFFASIDWATVLDTTNITTTNTDYTAELSDFLMEEETVVYCSLVVLLYDNEDDVAVRALGKDEEGEEEAGFGYDGAMVMALTNRPRLFLVDPDSNSVALTMPWNGDLRVVVERTEHFRVLSSTGTYRFRDKNRRADLWGVKVAEAVRQYMANAAAAAAAAVPTSLPHPPQKPETNTAVVTSPHQAFHLSLPITSIAPHHVREPSGSQQSHQLLSRLRSTPRSARLYSQSRDAIGDLPHLPSSVDHPASLSLARASAESSVMLRDSFTLGGGGGTGLRTPSLMASVGALSTTAAAAAPMATAGTDPGASFPMMAVPGHRYATTSSSVYTPTTMTVTVASSSKETHLPAAVISPRAQPIDLAAGGPATVTQSTTTHNTSVDERRPPGLFSATHHANNLPSVPSGINFAAVSLFKQRSNSLYGNPYPDGSAGGGGGGASVGSTSLLYTAFGVTGSTSSGGSEQASITPVSLLPTPVLSPAAATTTTMTTTNAGSGGVGGGEDGVSGGSALCFGPPGRLPPQLQPPSASSSAAPATNTITPASVSHGRSWSGSAPSRAREVYQRTRKRVAYNQSTTEDGGPSGG